MQAEVGVDKKQVNMLLQFASGTNYIQTLHYLDFIVDLLKIKHYMKYLYSKSYTSKALLIAVFFLPPLCWKSNYRYSIWRPI